MVKKKIAFVIGSLSHGGAERVISSLSNQLIDRYDIVIITFVKSVPFYNLHKDIKVIACKDSIVTPTSIFKSLQLNYQLVRRISKIMKKEQIDISIGFITSANILATLASKINRIPCIISERNNPMMEDVSKFWVTLRKFVYPTADNVILQTQGIKKFYENKLNAEKITILPNPISSELSKSRKDNPVRKKTILTVGRLDKNKCQDLLIKAFKKINVNDWEIIMIGDGYKKPELEQLILDCDLSHQVRIIGKVKDIHTYYNEAGIFVFTSKTEGFPNALLEAMHFGIPTISTDCPFGPADLINDGDNGFLIPLGDQKLLERQLLTLINDLNLRESFSENAKKTTEEYDSDIVTNKWEEVIVKVLNK